MELRLTGTKLNWDKLKLTSYVLAHMQSEFWLDDNSRDHGNMQFNVQLTKSIPFSGDDKMRPNTSIPMIRISLEG